jgi:hypothetical protein
MHKFTLIENALDSLEHAIVHLNKSNDLTKGDFKRVILDLSHVAELLFKERLRMIHPAFVLAKVDQYPSTTAHTVSATLALERLQKIGGVSFKEGDQAALKTIRDKRNEIEHYEFAISKDEARVLIGNILVFLFRFSSEEVGLDWDWRKNDDPTWSKLNEFAEFYEAHYAETEERIENKGIETLYCPTCRNDTYDTGNHVCLLCGHCGNILECSACKCQFVSSDWYNNEINLCPSCDREDRLAFANNEKY